MKTLFKKLVVFLLLLGSGYVLVYTVLDRYYNPSRDDIEDVIYMWGDSQLYQGINLSLFAKQTGKTIYSAAKHGAGVYDFLVFAQRVPKHAHVIISVSKLVQVRRKEMDNNMSGISLSAISTLSESDYNVNDLFSILYKNKRPYKYYYEKNNLFKNRDSIILQLPISHFAAYYKNVPDFLSSKQKGIKNGIKLLHEKQCSITYINLPFHSILDSIESDSPIKRLTDQFYDEIYSECKKDTLILRSSKNLMHDLSHVNGSGANLITHYISNQESKSDKNAVIYIQLDSD